MIRALTVVYNYCDQAMAYKVKVYRYVGVLLYENWFLRSR